jgi:hypothetical protein
LQHRRGVNRQHIVGLFRARFKIRRFWVTQASGVALPVKAGLVSNAM